MKLKISYLGLLFLMLNLALQSVAQSPEIKRIDPTNWYINFNGNKLQLLVYGKDLKTAKVSLKNYAGVSLQKVNTVENANYLFLDLTIAATTKPGFITLNFEKNGKITERKYELKQKNALKTKGVNNNDLIYLLMPDRF